jgi:flagellar motor switch protein FliN/FliY
VSLEALSKLGPGSLVELSRQPDDPVDVLINGRLVARGEVVVVAGNYGVRVTQVVSADERLRTLNG